MTRIVLSLTIIAALYTPISQAKEQLNVLSTINPVHALVTAIAGDLAKSKQIIPNNASPHHYSLKPSDLRKLYSADLIFRIDPELESFLDKSLRSVSQKKIITLSESSDLVKLAVTTQHEHRHGEEDEDNHKTNEEPTTLDYHLWLNPENAIAMAHTIQNTLIATAPEHKDQFITNTQQLVNNIRDTDKKITQQLEAVKETPFLVMHDAWQYFTTHYQLKQLGTISAQERLKPSAKALLKAKKTIIDSDVKCLITEPNLKRKTLNLLTGGLEINVTEIDPLGREIPQSNLAYPQLLQYTADKLLNCLEKK